MTNTQTYLISYDPPYSRGKNYGNGQVIVLISTLSNWFGILSNRKPKSQRELENAIDEALNDLSLNIVQACIKKTQKVYEQFLSSY